MKINGHDVKPDAKCFNADGVSIDERNMPGVWANAEYHAKREGIDLRQACFFVEPHATGFIFGLDYPGRVPTSQSDLDILSREGWS